MTELSIQNNFQDSSDRLISPNLVSIPSPSLPLQLGLMASGSGTNFAAVAKAIASSTHLDPKISPSFFFSNDKYLMIDILVALASSSFFAVTS